jgi:hypothetical protein
MPKVNSSSLLPLVTGLSLALTHSWACESRVSGDSGQEAKASKASELDELPKQADGPTAAERQALAAEAYLWGFPMVEGYKSLYQQSLDEDGPGFHAPMNKIGSVAHVATPGDKTIITPNSDTPYSFLWMDLRAEPLVISLPKMDPGRYFSVQLVDLYTFNFAYIHPPQDPAQKSDYLIAGPDWRGEIPEGVTQVFRAETSLAYGLFRTQLFSPDDIGQVQKLQDQYKVRGLSDYLGTPKPPPAPRINFPRYDPQKANGVEFFSYLSFLLQFAPEHPSDAAARERFARIGVRAGQEFEASSLSAESREAMRQGIADADRRLEVFVQEQVNTGKVTSAQLFGTREFLGEDPLFRFAGAKLGIYGNSASEADYMSYYVDGEGRPLDAGQHDYSLRFASGKLPPTKAFWSVTLYDARTKLLVDNPIHRYLINSTMLSQLNRDEDGGVTLYVQHMSPEGERAANWLPAPKGPFFMVLRNYLPQDSVLERSWRKPPLVADR